MWFVKSTANPLEHYTTYSNGVTFMDFNLGAFGNSNGAKDSSKQILDSYGLYYQWGRKEPFQRPYYFDAAGADDETRYTDVESLIAYINDHPGELNFSCGAANSWQLLVALGFLNAHDCADKVVEVPYTSARESALALMAGDVDFALLETANDPGQALACPGVEEKISRFAQTIRSTLLKNL